MLEKLRKGSIESSKIKKLGKNLKPLIKGEILDFILFGSNLKGKSRPRDLDIAIVVKGEDIDLDTLSKIRSEVKRIIETVDTEIVSVQDLYLTKFGFNILTEGYSVREGRFIYKTLDLKPFNIYHYSLKKLSKSKKPAFSRALKTLVKDKKGDKLGRGVVKVSKKNSGEIEDFLKDWDVWEDTEKIQALEY